MFHYRKAISIQPYLLHVTNVKGDGETKSKSFSARVNNDLYGDLPTMQRNHG